LAFAFLLLLTYGAAAVVGGFGSCGEPCGGPSADCSALCLDCACCPNGTSTPGEGVPQISVLSSSESAFEIGLASHPSAPPADILHVPKSLLA
jgi:hypothetical protein